MTHLDVRCGSAPRSGAIGSRGLIGWVATNNPFYVLSALMVWLGLWVSFGSHANAHQTWALLFGMVGYTLLLAVTASLLVRFVGVWDDVRTVLLLVVLMFLATSVTFDEVLARSLRRGIVCYLLGLVFAAALSEWILRSIRLSLPLLFRGPYYVILTLFFVYPVALTPLLDQPRSEALSWALFGFSPAAGLAFLTLLPAVRRGREYVRENGSPWPWAWFPWTLFGVLAFGVAGRSALLCWSMHHLPLGHAEPYIFGLYFLVPFGLMIGVLVLEIGLVERHRGTVRAALSIPLLLVVLSSVGHRPEAYYQSFLAQFSARLGGTPLYLALLLAAGFYAYAALRRVAPATELLTITVAALAFVAPGTLELGGLAWPRPLPLLAVGVVQLALGSRRRESWRCLLGGAFLVWCATIALPRAGLSAPRGPLAYHLVLLAVLGAGAAFDDTLARVLRTGGSVLALLGALLVMTGQVDDADRRFSAMLDFYPLALAVVLAGYGFLLADRVSRACAALLASTWLLATAWRGYCAVRQVIAGVDYVAVGMVFFSLAVLTSMVKGGVLPWKLVQRNGKMPNAPDRP